MSNRAILLPPYMTANPMWVDLALAVDELFADIDQGALQLRNLRNAYTLESPIQRGRVQNGLPLDESTSVSDMTTLLKQVGYCGLPLVKTDYLTSVQARMLFRHLPEYWYSKGTGGLAHFINYVLGTNLSFRTLWTSDYVTFETEPPTESENYLENGGSWYQTTHIQVDLGNSNSTSPLAGVSLSDFISFLDDISGYTLVVHSVVSTLTLPIVVSKEKQTTPIVSLGLLIEEEW